MGKPASPAIVSIILPRSHITEKANRPPKGRPMAKVATVSLLVDEGPAKRLAAEPTVESPADIETALVELSWIQAKTAATGAALTATITALKEQALDNLAIEIDGETINFADRSAALTAAVTHYANQNQAALGVTPRNKTAKFSHGRITWKKTPEKIAYADNQAAAIAKIGDLVNTAAGDAGTLTERTANWLRRRLVVSLDGEPDIYAADLLDLKPAVSLSRVKLLREQGRLDKQTARKFGLKIVERHETTTIDPTPYPLHVSRSATK
jgi:hypothetical protein